MSLKSVHAYIDKVFPEHLDRTRAFLRQPSISVERRGLIETAQWLADTLKPLGAQIQLVGDQSAPIVYARFDLGSPKTLLVYGMYDVQPVSGQDWHSDPFAAEIREMPGIGPCIIARGACNSKGPLLGFLNVLDAFKQADAIPVNLILTLEGEEEIGSPNLPKFYQQHKTELIADAGFEPFWANYGTDVDRPIISLGSKGIITVELVCRGGKWGGPVKHDVHSSVGAWLASPSWRMLKAINTLVDENESIKIAHFDDETIPPTAEDEDLLVTLGTEIDAEHILRSLGALRFKYNLNNTDLLRRYLFSPSINIGRLPQISEDVIPYEVHAQLIVRIVPKMDPERTVAKIHQHLIAHGFDDIEVQLTSAYPSSRTSIHAPVVQCMLETYRDHATEPQIWPLMASATPYYLFSDILGIPYVWGGLGQAGGSHAPDEYASVEGLKLFEKSTATFLSKFSQT